VSNKKKYEKEKTHDMNWLKARTIKAGETPQKSLNLPPVHLSVNSVFTLNTHIFYKNLGDLGDTF